MKNSIIIFLLFSSFILGFLINEFLFDKQIYFFKEETIKNMQSKSKKDATCHHVTDKKFVSCLPKFIEEDIKKYNIDTTKLSKQKWSKFLFLVGKEREDKFKSYISPSFIQASSLLPDKRLLEYLVSINIDLNKKDNFGTTALMMVAKNSLSVNTLKFLSENGANLFEKDNMGNDILDYAFNNKNKHTRNKLVDFLLSNGYDLENNVNKYFNSMLSYENKYAMKYYQKADPNYTNNEMKNLLEIAIEKGASSKIIQDFIDRYDISNRKNNHYTALHIGALQNKIDTKTFNKLIKKGFDVNAKIDKTLQTPLMYAVRGNNIDKIKILLENGADIHATDCNGKDAYYYLTKSVQNKNIKDKIKSFLDHYK